MFECSDDGDTETKDITREVVVGKVATHLCLTTLTTTLNILFSVVGKESEMSVEQGRGGNHTK